MHILTRSYTPNPEARYKITLDLSKAEARTLFRLSCANVTIPNYLCEQYNQDAGREARDLLNTLHEDMKAWGFCR